MAVGEGIATVLRAAYDPADFERPLEMRVVTARDFAEDQIDAGVSIFLYRVLANGGHRSPPSRPGPDGRRRPNLLPLDLHYLLTFWAPRASLQHVVAGWAMRALEDAPLLHAPVLNAVAAGSFRTDECVEIGLAELPNDDLLRVWEVLGVNAYHLTVPYVARTVRIESTVPRPSDDGPAVQTRTLDAGLVRMPEALSP